VSPQHAWEARYTEQRQGLGHTLHVHPNKFGGVLNGVDNDMWNPEIDHLIPEQYSSERLDGKYADKRALRDRFLLTQEFKAVVASIGRLDRQKGVHLIRHTLFYGLAHGAPFILPGTSPAPVIASEFGRLKYELNACGTPIRRSSASSGSTGWGRSLMGAAGSGLFQHLRTHQAQVSKDGTEHESASRVRRRSAEHLRLREPH